MVGVPGQPLFRHGEIQLGRRSYVLIAIGLEILLFLLGVLMVEVRAASVWK
jgi:hypothetical protein